MNDKLDKLFLKLSRRPLQGFFPYFGNKICIADKYPKPIYPTICEPFAGSAGYSLRYYWKKVILIDKDPSIVNTWKFLLQSSVSDILSLPTMVPGQSIYDLNVSDDARTLIGWWIGGYSGHPYKTFSKGRGNRVGFGDREKQLIASQVEKIRHWKISYGDASTANNDCITWFVDPPYINAGKWYTVKYHNHYTELADWVKSRQGQVIVCESRGATWLPFKPLVVYQGQKKLTTEMVYCQNNHKQLVVPQV